MKGLTILLVGLLLFAGGAMFGTSHSTTDSVSSPAPSNQSVETCSPELKEEESPLIVDVAVGMGESVGAGFDLVLMIMSDLIKT
ncbi:hypothetical protein MUO14_02010 [Halobacillus shinanisalinarum]|uniref:Uncharacterized protein n=1 Tax=Halobacillus shinanisalinarum TaxID=2932258 RepID=A0ABY4H043_9BACI|nr:hypothetical protein [Halobacillus shinanisalinarum]UOQ93793.1 hypothetical protein MUO14_02010 [Halobacillus shinanisalinarum]